MFIGKYLARGYFLVSKPLLARVVHFLIHNNTNAVPGTTLKQPLLVSLLEQDKVSSLIDGRELLPQLMTVHYYEAGS